MSAASACPAVKNNPIMTKMAIVFLQDNPFLSFLCNMYPVSADFIRILLVLTAIMVMTTILDFTIAIFVPIY
jgi:hypothetical protein